MARNKRQPQFLLKKNTFSADSPEILSDADGDPDNSLGWLNHHFPKGISVQKKPPKRTKLQSDSALKESVASPKIIEATEVPKSINLTNGEKKEKLINRLSLEQRIAYISNVLSSFPLIWCLYDTVSGSSFEVLENNAFEGAVSSAKAFVKSITNLIAQERECIFADTPLASERLLSFRAIKKRLLSIQNVLHESEGPSDSSYLEPLSNSLKTLDLAILQYSTKNVYVHMQIGDIAILNKHKADQTNQVTYNGLHSPVFKLIKSVGQDGYAWSEGDTIQAVRLYFASNKSRLATAGKDPQSLCLLEVRMGPAPSFATLVTKPFGNCYELLDSQFTLGSPVGWIWAVVLNIEIISHPTSKSNKFHVPTTFTKIGQPLAKTTHNYLFDWFEKRNAVSSPESVAF